MARLYKDRKGVDVIHLFNKEWRVGRLTHMKHTNRPHCVIYSPDDKQYDVYDRDAENIRATRYDYYDDQVVSLTRSDRPKTKIYILTNIMDKKENWETDLEKKPSINSTVKVIYDNGTIKNITFTGEWEKLRIPRNTYLDDGTILKTDKQYFKNVTPVMYRK